MSNLTKRSGVAKMLIQSYCKPIYTNCLNICWRCLWNKACFCSFFICQTQWQLVCKYCGTTASPVLIWFINKIQYYESVFHFFMFTWILYKFFIDSLFLLEYYTIFTQCYKPSLSLHKKYKNPCMEMRFTVPATQWLLCACMR